MRWSPCGRLLASGSDDRSLRLWAMPPAVADSTSCSSSNGSRSHNSSNGTTQVSTLLLQPQRVLWGHANRLWDCCFGGASDGSSSSFLVTASEDCTLRVWCLASGEQLAAIQVRWQACRRVCQRAVPLRR